MDPLHLLIVADDPLVRAGLSLLMSELPACVIDGQMNSVEAIAELDAEFGDPPPDIILWDWGWDTEVLAVDLVEAGIPIVALMADSTRAMDAWNAGIRILISRSSPAEKLLDAARAARQGLIVLDPVLELEWFHMLDAPEPTLVEELTPREQEVLELLAEGLTNKAIAQRLDISTHTVKFHVNAVMGKFGAQSRTGAVVQATRQGLISL